MSEVFPNVEYSNWPACNRLIPYAQLLTSLIDEYGFKFPETAKMLNKAGNYLIERAQYAEAEPFFKRALDIREKALGAEHPNVADSLDDLAELYIKQSGSGANVEERG